MTTPARPERTTLSVSKKARQRIKTAQERLRKAFGYKPGYSELVIKGMEALEREQETATNARDDSR